MFLSFINIYLMQIYSREGIRDLTGRVVSETDIIRAQFVTILFSIPLISFILRALVSFIPYKKKKYSQKYISFSLLILLSIQTFLFIYTLVDNICA